MSAGPARVLAALRSTGGGPCSGEALSSELEVSRAQIWKHVESLRKRGYEIDGEPGGGYRLRNAPDRLYPEEVQAGLSTRWLAREIHHFDETDSTNRVALELGAAGAPHGATVIAEGQSSGRGRLGRSFHSPPYQNLYTTILLRPSLSIADAPTLILSAGVAVAESVAATLGESGAERVEIKWPNDVLVDGRKSSGILMELAVEETQIGIAVLGIGVNLNVDPAGFPEEFRARATSLRACRGDTIDRADFARRLYQTLEGVLDLHFAGGFAAVRPRFESWFQMRNAEIEVAQLDGAQLAGRAEGIAENGALLLRDAAGHRHTLLAGDVTLAKKELS